MNYLILFFIFLLGTIVGSFVNVVAMRLNTGLPIGNGRSMCFNCGTHLKWYEMIPIFSFIFLRGKCRTCGIKFSSQYFWAEVITGLTFVGIAIRQYHLWPVYGEFSHGLLYSALFFVYYAVIFCVLMIIVLYDIKHFIIPNGFVYTFIVLSVVKLGFFLYLKGFQFEKVDIYNILAPLALFGFFALIWFISKGEWIGFGDAKLALGIGAMLGFTHGLSSIILAFWIGAVWGIFLIVRSRLSDKDGVKVGLRSEVPFAPFLILGTFIVFFTQIDVLGLTTVMNFLN